MIFPEYYGAPVFAGVEFDLTSGISGHCAHMYTDADQAYLVTITLREVHFSGGVGALADSMAFGLDTFRTEAQVIRAVGCGVTS